MLSAHTRFLSCAIAEVFFAAGFSPNPFMQSAGTAATRAVLDRSEIIPTPAPGHEKAAHWSTAAASTAKVRRAILAYDCATNQDMFVLVGLFCMRYAQ